jgi:hypothetical protein
MRAMTSALSLRARSIRLSLVGNFGGALLSFLYFRQIDITASRVTPPVGASERLIFLAGFALLWGLLAAASARWRRPLEATAGAPLPGAAGDVARRRALQMPAYLALLTWAGWLAAGLLWGALVPMLSGGIPVGTALRVVFGIGCVGGTFVAASMFFGIERIWRSELPRWFPDGDLSAAGVPGLRVRQRLLAVLLLVSGLPLTVLAVAALTRAHALLGADAATAAGLVDNLIGVVVVIAAGGLVASFGLATLLAGSIAGPLQDLQQAMAQVTQGRLDVRCGVT